MSWYERPYAGGRGGASGFFENPLTWTPTLGRLFGIRIRVHMLFMLFVGYELLRASVQGWFPAAAHYLLLLWTFVLMHEFGHCFAARSVGGSADEILLWPLGGLANTVATSERLDLPNLASVLHHADREPEG